MNLFTLKAVLGIDDSKYKNGIKNAIESGKKLAVSIGRAAVAASAAAGAGAAALTKMSLDSYADFEQLVGGVETLFGKSAGVVERYAQTAYKTAGLSANEYMETVTSFSASLLQSLGGDTKKAAEYANMAVTDMSDNANKMGTDIGMIQNAYQGFAKGNYTMLDNLKLGYGGTAREMARLINDSGVLSEKQKINIDDSQHLGEALQGVGFDKIILAINKTQERMGIMGTTSKEAASTIQGSVASVKGAFSNLMTAIADENANLGASFGIFIESVKTAGSNIIPRIQIIHERIVALSKDVFSKILSNIKNSAPTLIKNAVGIFQGFLSKANEAIPKIKSVGVEILKSLVISIQNGIPKMKTAALNLLQNFGNTFKSNMPKIAQKGLEIVSKIAEKIRSNAGKMVDSAIAIIVPFAKNIIQGITNSIPAIIREAPKIVSSLANAINDNAPKILASAVYLMGEIAKGLIRSIPTIIRNIPQIIRAIWNAFTAFNWMNLGSTLIQSISSGIRAMGSFARNAAHSVVQSIWGGFKGIVGSFKNIGRDIVRGLISGITGMLGWVKDRIFGFGSTVISAFKNVLGIHSPSRVMRDQVGHMMGEGLALGIEDEYSRVNKAMSGLYSKGTASGSMPFDSAAGAAPASYGLGSVTININGAKYSDEKALAERVAYELQNMMDRRKAAYA